MIKKSNIFALATISVFWVSHTARAQLVLYESNFDALAIAKTEAPARSDHDGWTMGFHPPLSVGEIQNTIANLGNALHEYTDISNTNAQGTFDVRDLNNTDVTGLTAISLSIDFYASSSNLNISNPYDARFAVQAVEGQGSSVIDFRVSSGNGRVKQQRGLDVQLISFNGSNNNFVFDTANSRGLAWDTWHSLELVADLQENVWSSITVDGATESLTTFGLPMFGIGPGGASARPQAVDRLLALVLNLEDASGESSDSIYFDNVRITVVPEPNTAFLFLIFSSALLAARQRRIQ